MSSIKLSHLSDEKFSEHIDQRRKNRMSRIDNMSPEMRSLVNDYGLAVVDSLISVRVVEPRQIRHVVETILDNFSPTRGTSSAQGIRAKRDDEQ